MAKFKNFKILGVNVVLGGGGGGAGKILFLKNFKDFF
jgi:hypothetical protein